MNILITITIIIAIIIISTIITIIITKRDLATSADRRECSAVSTARR